MAIDMKQKYYKIKKEIAARAGLDERLREADGEYLLLSEKDVRMISLTFDEKLHAIGACSLCEDEEIEDDILQEEKVEETDETEEDDNDGLENEDDDTIIVDNEEEEEEDTDSEEEVEPETTEEDEH